ncbi:hypothetical protein JCM6882_003592 [Rhodosporidiobolus microsporus]
MSAPDPPPASTAARALDTLAAAPSDTRDERADESSASGDEARGAGEGGGEGEQAALEEDEGVEGVDGAKPDAVGAVDEPAAPSSTDVASSPSTSLSSSSAPNQPAAPAPSVTPSSPPTAPEPAAPSPSAPPPRRKRYTPLPPPPKGILRPPSSSHAGPSSASRFSFRRDVLQSLTAGAPAGAVAGGVQEAVGSAASVAGGLLGSAWKRLGQVAGAVVQEQQAVGVAVAGAGGAQPSSNAASSSLASLASSSSSTLVDPASSTSTLVSTSSSSSTPVATSSPALPPPAPSHPHPLPVRSLRRVRFRVGRALSITYPINRGTLEPIAPEEEGATRERVEGEWRAGKGKGVGVAAGGFGGDGGGGKGKEKEKREKGHGGEGRKEWTGTELQLLYAEICRLREEPGIDKVKRAFRESPTAPPPKTLDLSHTPLSLGAAEALADLVSVDWGCRKVVLDSCGLDDESLRPLLNALLVSASVPTLSLANNKRIKQKGWKLLAVFVRKASFLRYLDLSDSTLDRRAAEWLVQALNPVPSPTPPPVPPPPPPVPAAVAAEAEDAGPPLPAKPSANGVASNGEGAQDEEQEQGKKKVKKVAGPWDDEEDSSDEEVVVEPEKKETVEPEEEGETPKESAAPASAPPVEVDNKAEKPATEQAAEGAEQVERAPAPPEPVEPLFDSAPLLKDDEEDGGAVGAVMTLKLDNCGWRGGALEALANGLRTSQLKHLSLRRNRINAQNAVHLAVLIRDYPLSSSTTSTSAATSTASLPSDGPLLIAPWAFSLNNGGASGGGAIHPALESPAASTSSSAPFFSDSANSVTARQRPLPPPPSSSRAPAAPAAPAANGHGHDLSDASASEDDAGVLVERPTNPQARAEREAWRLSEARLRLRKQVDELPQVGALLTLDVKGNDIRNGVGYIAQVLKRNRTLKVLNLSENKIDVQGLVAVSEALKYNNSLETLDLSFNPCCGPTSIDGVLALRSALMVTRSLKRVFLNHTALTSDGAIALAEFLPESRALHHLDLTDNQIDISGVLALSVSLKLNTTIRCLDLNIPFDDPDFSRLSFDILQTCVRNTELAQAEAEAKASSKRVVIAQPIRKSALASNLEAQQKAIEERQRRREHESRTQLDIFAAAAETRDVVAELLAVDQDAAAKGESVAASEVIRDALMQVQLCEAQLSEAVTGARQGEQRERAETLLVELASLLDLAKALYDKPQPPLPPSASSLNGAASDEEESDEATPKPASPIQATSPTLVPPPASSSPLTTPSHPDALDALDIPAPSSPSTRSPVESTSRAMVAEESEVFRKGLALGVDDVPSDSEDDDEGSAPSSSSSANHPHHAGAGLGLGLGAERDVSGEELKREILETEEEEVRRAQEAQGLPGRRRGSRGSFSAEEAERVRAEVGVKAGEGQEEGGEESAVA